MAQIVYLETTVISYLTARPSRLPSTALLQTETRRWWRDRRGDFELVISDAVLDEVRDGDPHEAAKRLAVLQGILVVPSSIQAEELTRELARALALPPAASLDAAHIALAASARVDYLLTWNCKHIANAVLRPRIESTCLRCGCNAPVICTPSELL